MLRTLLALAALLAGADTVPPAGAQSAPAFIVLRAPAVPLVALRLSVVADDPPGYAGAGHLMQHLHEAMLEERVARVGGRVQAIRTSDAVVYTVVGPASELDHLASTLAAALRPPAPNTGELLTALRALESERAAEREVAPAYVRGGLRARIFPDALSGAGTDAAASRLRTARLADVWSAMYRPERVSVVAVGDVELESVRSAFSAIPPGTASAVPALPDSVRPFAADTPQATRAWIGRGWAADAADPATLSVTARLLRNHLRRRMTRSEVEVEHWWTQHGQALALVVATPDTLAPVARRTVDGALAALRDNLDPAAVRDAAASLRREMLLYARTPERMAELLGGFADRGEGPDAAQRFYAAVERVREEDVHALLETLLTAPPEAVDVAAQRVVAR
jgi:predicted Zn-dependent peptidase